MSATDRSGARKLARGHVRAARAAFLFAWLEEYEAYDLALMHDDLRQFTRSELQQAVDDLVENRRAVLEVHQYGIRVRLLILEADEIAEAA